MHDDVVRRVEPLALELVGDHGDRAVRLVAHDAAAAVLAGELAALEVEGVAVAVAGWIAKHGHATVVVDPAHLHVVGDVAPDQIAADAVPCRTFGPQRPRVQPLDRRVADDVAAEARSSATMSDRDRHGVWPDQSRGVGSGRTGGLCGGLPADSRKACGTSSAAVKKGATVNRHSFILRTAPLYTEAFSSNPSRLSRPAHIITLTLALKPGARLGPYKIVAPLGAGGMGEVYKARDTRLDRTVAIKVLPAAGRRDPQFRDRFDGKPAPSPRSRIRTSARSTTSARHRRSRVPGHGTLQGETLHQRLTRTARERRSSSTWGSRWPMASTPRIGAGIVHRDIKPANIF